MTTQEVMIPLPENLYLRLQRVAQATQQSFTLRKVHAAALLRWRGYKLPPADKL